MKYDILAEVVMNAFDCGFPWFGSPQDFFRAGVYTVSYTHLDVYKRQVYRYVGNLVFPFEGGNSFFKEIGEDDEGEKDRVSEFIYW